jgi:hypothetical protein
MILYFYEFIILLLLSSQRTSKGRNEIKIPASHTLPIISNGPDTIFFTHSLGIPAGIFVRKHILFHTAFVYA